jgi:hypothetical protein
MDNTTEIQDVFDVSFLSDMERSELARINSQFNAELQQQIAGTLPTGYVYKLGNPSSILLCASIKDFPIELSSQRLYDKTVQPNHPLDIQNVRNLPYALASPIAVFESTKHDGSSVILTELQQSGYNFVAALRIRTDYHDRKIKIEVNDIKSIYPKDSVVGIFNWINSPDKLMRWIDKLKMKRFISTQSTNLIGGGDKAESLNAAKVVKNFENPKILIKKIGNVELSADQQQLLYNGEIITIEGATDRNGKKYPFLYLQLDMKINKLRIYQTLPTQKQSAAIPSASIIERKRETPKRRGFRI